MKTLFVSIEKDGVMIPVGSLRGEGPSDTRFQYTDQYLEAAGAPISISLPLRPEAFSPAQTACFFEGLLP